MAPDFAGRTAELYARYRRDLPRNQASMLAEEIGLQAEDVLVDLGCGTGQLVAPLTAHCRAALALDPEPAMLAGLRARRLPGVLPVLAADTDLPNVATLLRTAPAAVVIDNAAHWMDLGPVADTAATMLRPGGCMAVVTQGPPLWLGTSSWQLDLRAYLEGRFGPVADSCGSDEEALENRAAALRDRGWRTDVLRRHAVHPVDPSWIIGHLGSALPADAADADLIHDLGAHLGPGPGDRVEQVETTVLLARPS